MESVLSVFVIGLWGKWLRVHHVGKGAIEGGTMWGWHRYEKHIPFIFHSVSP
jgi:hypothetical protein